MFTFIKRLKGFPFLPLNFWFLPHTHKFLSCVVVSYLAPYWTIMLKYCMCMLPSLYQQTVVSHSVCYPAALKVLQGNTSAVFQSWHVAPFYCQNKSVSTHLSLFFFFMWTRLELQNAITTPCQQLEGEGERERDYLGLFSFTVMELQSGHRAIWQCWPHGSYGGMLFMLYTGLWLQVQQVSLANGAHMLGKGDVVWRVMGKRGNGGKDYKRPTSHGLSSCLVT